MACRVYEIHAWMRWMGRTYLDWITKEGAETTTVLVYDMQINAHNKFSNTKIDMYTLMKTACYKYRYWLVRQYDIILYNNRDTIQKQRKKVGIPTPRCTFLLWEILLVGWFDFFHSLYVNLPHCVFRPYLSEHWMKKEGYELIARYKEILWYFLKQGLAHMFEHIQDFSQRHTASSKLPTQIYNRI